jgi:hypothetical protein
METIMATVGIKRLFAGQITYGTSQDFTQPPPHQKRNAANGAKTAKPTIKRAEELSRQISTPIQVVNK